MEIFESITFVDKNFQDKPNFSAKDQIIPLLDEAPKEDLIGAYEKIINTIFTNYNIQLISN